MDDREVLRLLRVVLDRFMEGPLWETEGRRTLSQGVRIVIRLEREFADRVAGGDE